MQSKALLYTDKAYSCLLDSEAYQEMDHLISLVFHIFLFQVLQSTFIRGSVRPSVGRLVGQSVGRSVGRPVMPFHFRRYQSAVEHRVALVHT